MDSDMYDVPMDIASRHSAFVGMQNSMVGFNSIDQRALAGFPMLSAMQGEPVSEQLHMGNDSDSNTLATLLGRNVTRDGSFGSCCSIDNVNFQGQLDGGTLISSPSLANLVAARCGLQENTNNLLIPATTIYPDVHRNYIAGESSNDLNSSYAATVNCGYNEVLGNMNDKWELDHSRTTPPHFGGKASLQAGFQQFSATGNLHHPNEYMSSDVADVTTDCLYGASEYSNELSLSLATSQPALIGGTNIPDQCSGISSNNKELSLSFGCHEPAQFAQFIARSKYLQPIQEILAQIASYSLENQDDGSYLTGERRAVENVQHSSSSNAERGVSPMDHDESPDTDSSFNALTSTTSHRQSVEVKKSQLLTLLQVVLHIFLYGLPICYWSGLVFTHITDFLMFNTGGRPIQPVLG